MNENHTATNEQRSNPDEELHHVEIYLDGKKVAGRDLAGGLYLSSDASRMRATLAALGKLEPFMAVMEDVLNDFR